SLKRQRGAGFMLEHVLQMGPMLVLAGLVAGWVAEVVSRADGHGFIRDLAVGLVGSVVGGATLWVVVCSEAGMLVMCLVGVGRATLAILAQRRFWRSVRLGTEHPGGTCSDSFTT